MNGLTWMMRGLTGAALTGLVWGAAAVRAQQPAAVQPVAAATAVKPAAVVNGELIAMAELDAILKQAPMPVEVPEEVRKGIRRHALTMLIDDTLMQQFLRTNAPPILKADVDAKMAEMDAALKKDKKSVESFCKDNGQTVQELREGLTWMLRWSSWAKSHINDDQVYRYYQEYKDFFDGTTVRASHIALRMPENATEADKAKAKAQLTETTRPDSGGQTGVRGGGQDLLAVREQ